MADDRPEELVFLPLGGVGEIGMNLALYGYGHRRNRRWIVVDFGISFANDTMPGVDLVYPDISFLVKHRSRVEGIFLTHAHEDHFGALIDLWQDVELPVYATAFAAGLLEAKLQREPGNLRIPVTTVRAGQRIKAGPFEVEYVNVAHSIPESNALAIRTPTGTVLHSGDYRLDPEPALGDPTDERRLVEIGDEGVLALVSDSTNALREGESLSEGVIARELKRIVASASGRVAVTTFASNVGRLKSVAEAAAAAGRNVVLSGRAFHRSVGVARELGMLNGIAPMLDEDAFHSLPRDKVVVLMTGSQGESRASVARVARDEHPRVSLAEGDTFVYSARSIPGNEKGVIDILNAFADRGVELITADDLPVHASGHPRRDEMRQMYSWIRPRVAVPVHGEPMHLRAHARLAREAGAQDIVLARDGAVVRLGPGKAEIVDHIKLEPQYLDGDVIGAFDEIGAAARRRLSFGGHIVVMVVVNDKGEMLADPEIRMEGIPQFTVNGAAMGEVVYEAVLDIIETLPRPRRRDPDALEQSVRRGVRSNVEDAWGRRPNCTVVTVVV